MLPSSTDDASLAYGRIEDCGDQLKYVLLVHFFFKNSLQPCFYLPSISVCNIEQFGELVYAHDRAVFMNPNAGKRRQQYSQSVKIGASSAPSYGFALGTFK